MVNDPIGDLLTRIRNGQNAGLEIITSRSSKHRVNVLEVLKREGCIRDFRVEDDEKGLKRVVVELKYAEGRGAIRKIDRVSKPGRRVHSAIKDLQPYYNGLGFYILSTPRGVMSDKEAREANVGGEVVASVF